MKDAENLLDRYLKGNCTAEEKLHVESWLDAHHIENTDWDKLPGAEKTVWLSSLFADINEEILGTSSRTQGSAKSVRLWPRIAVAAAAVAAIVTGVYFFNYRSEVASVPRNDVVQNDIAPGKNGATITLANGKVIQLSDAKSGVVVGEGDLKYDDGVTVQGGDPDLRQDDVMQMTASTARGQTYQFTLPDGTRVWLNADSKISFPAQFSGKERKILLSGEGYFEVAKDKAHPFIVASDLQEVEVLGTHFNISAYKDEGDVKTTLLEGSVRVNLMTANVDKSTRMLTPGQQSVLSGDGVIKVSSVDTELAVAWKNNQFLFDNAELGAIMRMVERWYNVDVVFMDEISREKFGGGVSRFDKVSKVLQSLETTGKVHFKVEGRKIYVSK